MKFRALLLLCFSLLPTGCVDYQEDFSIRANGSGDIHSIIAVHKMLDRDGGEKLKTDLESLTASAPGLALEHYRTFENEEKERVLDFKISFGDVKDLRGALSGGGAEIARFFGSFEAENQSDRFVMTRTLNFADAEAMNPVVKTLGQLSGERTLTYRMQFPFEVLSANSESIDTGGRAVTWKIPLSQAMKEPVTLRAEIHKPKIAQVKDRIGPTGFWSALVLIAFALIAGAAIVVRRWRKQTVTG